MRWTTWSMGLMMDSIPNYLIIPPSCHTSTYSKDQFPFKCFFQQLKHLVPFFVVWKIGSSMSRWETNISSFTSMHMIIYNNGPYILKSITMHHRVDNSSHSPCRLVTIHLSKNSRTDRTTYPILLPFQPIKTIFM